MLDMSSRLRVLLQHAVPEQSLKQRGDDPRKGSKLKYSVIVSVYNTELYLRKCLDSLLNQIFPEFEIIVVDDGSTDGSPEICDAYAKLDNRIRVIHQKNRGLIAARNTGLFAASGEYITYIDSDDWADPGMIAFVDYVIRNARSDLDAVLFSANEVFADRVSGMPTRIPNGVYGKKKMGSEIYPYLFSDRRKGFRKGGVVMAHTWNKFFKRSIQLEHYCRDTSIRMFTDIPLTYESLLACDTVYICNKKLYYYNRMNEHSIRTVGRYNTVTQSSVSLVTYLRERLSPFGSEYGLDRQLNDYPAILLLQNARGLLSDGKTIHEAAEDLREKVKETNFLDLIDERRLPPKIALVIRLMKSDMYVPAFILVNGTVRRGKKNMKEKHISNPNFGF